MVAAITLAAQAAKQITSTIPIVMATTADAVGGGLVASLARPGGISQSVLGRADEVIQ